MTPGKLGIHGESLGGCVASYIARKCKVEFVFIDRTFASLTDVAYYSFRGKMIEWILLLFTRWNEQCWQNFMEIKDCYKVIGCDPEDKIITDLASLKCGISRYIV